MSFYKTTNSQNSVLINLDFTQKGCRELCFKPNPTDEISKTYFIGNMHKNFILNGILKSLYTNKEYPWWFKFFEKRKRIFTKAKLAINLEGDDEMGEIFLHLDSCPDINYDKF